ncbi:MAG: ribosome assembly RNA-binding protein YhbY [Pseudomonadota bacterium]
MNSARRKELRSIAHHLHPVIIVGDGGVSDAVINETNRALDDHELIKVKINAFDREDRAALGAHLTDACGAELVQKIGKVLVLFRQNPDAKPALSNLTRK